MRSSLRTLPEKHSNSGLAAAWVRRHDRNGAVQWLLPIALAAVLLGLFGVPATADEPAAKKAKDDDYYRLMQEFVDAFDQMERNYVKELDREALMRAAISGMVSHLEKEYDDPYSGYISSEQMDRFNQSVEQQFGGIGIQVQIDQETGRLMVMTPLPGTPAYEAGIHAGDLIMEIEGESTKGLTLSGAVKQLKGEVGQPVTLGIKHAGSDEIEQVEIVRDVIQVATVLGDSYDQDGRWDYMLDEEKKIGLIRVTHFSRRTSDELREALEHLEEQGVRGLILDLRFNPGGLLTQATEVADLFVESGKIVSTEGRKSLPRVWRASQEDTFSGFLMAVLVNRYSASASEIVSACLQDHDRAVIVGERTWGKGSVQNVAELLDGESVLKLTTATYHRPSGENIHRFPDSKNSDAWGVKPDDGYDLRLTGEQMEEYLEYRRQRDVLSEQGPPETDYTDPQLKKALDYILKQLGEKQEVPSKTDGTVAPPEEKPDESSKAAAESGSAHSETRGRGGRKPVGTC